ncbi:MAG: VTT domain-containing protein [Gammaproteobacteria bacterium]
MAFTSATPDIAASSNTSLRRATTYMLDHFRFEPGRNCWRVEHADRAAFLIDGECYFKAFREVVKQAQYAVFILGWDVDTRVRLVRNGWHDNLPECLAEFLDALVQQKPALNVYILNWDYAFIYAFEREWLPHLKLGWRTHPRLRFRLDNHLPLEASHHQKVVVVDDRVAFSGGMDLSKWRWDTSEHRPEDPRRVDPDGTPYPPYHDVQMMVEGSAARALGELARERWRRATGEQLPASPGNLGGNLWPNFVTPDLADVPIAIARTQPAYEEQAEVREVERLYRHAIAAARRWIFFENQYLTSRAIGEALAKRLAEAEGPEVVLILPLKTGGWLEQTTMDVLRARLLKRLRSTDYFHKLRVYYPHRADLGRHHIMVHSKVLIVDDALVRIGSSNLSNRSMGLDTECDLTIAATGEARIAAAIALLRDRLLGEHLGVAPEQVRQRLLREGSLIRAVDALRGGERTLEPLNGEVPADVDEQVPDGTLIDPERPIDVEKIGNHIVPKEHRKLASHRLVVSAAALLMLLALAAAWRWTPLGEWLDIGMWAEQLANLRGSWAVPVIVLSTFVVASLAAVPITLLIVAAGAIFGPFYGFVYAMAGAELSAIVTYFIGEHLGRQTLRRWAGSRIHRVSQILGRRGLLTVVLIRLVPVAPFTVVNLVAGASHIRLRDFAIGSLVGITPGVLALTVFSDRIVAAVQKPELLSFAILAIVVLLMAFGAWALRRWLPHRASASQASSSTGSSTGKSNREAP